MLIGRAKLDSPFSQEYKPIKTRADAQAAVAAAEERLDASVQDLLKANKHKKIGFGAVVGGMGTVLATTLAKSLLPQAVTLGLAVAGTGAAIGGGILLTNASMTETERRIEFPYRKDEVKLYQKLEARVEAQIAAKEKEMLEMQKLAGMVPGDADNVDIELDAGYVVIDGHILEVK